MYVAMLVVIVTKFEVCLHCSALTSASFKEVKKDSCNKVFNVPCLVQCIAFVTPFNFVLRFFISILCIQNKLIHIEENMSSQRIFLPQKKHTGKEQVKYVHEAILPFRKGTET